jgi:putative heme iron utilization protein
MSLSKELILSVRRRVAADPGIATAALAAELQTPEAEVVTALPLEMRRHAKVENFAAIWGRIATWKHTRVSINGSNGAVSLLPGGALPPGRQEGASFRFAAGGSLPLEDLPLWRLGSIWFVAKPLQGEESLSVRFFNTEGEPLFSVYLARDDAGRPDLEARRSYEALRQEYAIPPKPRARCKGCKNCTCGAV